MRIKILLLTICLLVLTNSALAQDGYTAEIEYINCPVALPAGEMQGQTIDCGVLIVPQDRNDPNGVYIRIAFAVLYSTSPSPAPDPVVYLEGGPGGSALSSLADWAVFEMRQTRDIIIFDQRGAGYSFPHLSCPELDDVPEDDEDGVFLALAMQDCRDRFEMDGIDIRHYNTINNANDTYDLLVALGYSEWNLFGISYGTRLALNIMRDFPQGIRSVILDSVYPPVVNAYEEVAVNGHRSFLQLFDDCFFDFDCNDAFPNLEPRFYALVDRLNDDPLLIDDEEFDGNALVNTMFEFFYDTSVIPYLPLMIDELDNGDYTVLVALLDGILSIQDDESDTFDPIEEFAWEYYDFMNEVDDDTFYDFYDELDYWDLTKEGLFDLFYDFFDEEVDYLLELLLEIPDDQMERVLAILYDEATDDEEDLSDSQGMFDAFECYEEVPFNSVARMLELSAGVPSQIANALMDLEYQMVVCSTWQLATAPQSETEAVISDIPTLIMTGNYDPITPPSWGRIAAQTLSNSTFTEFPGVGHAAIDGGECPLSIALAFIENPTTPPDLSCISGMTLTFITEMPDFPQDDDE